METYNDYLKAYDTDETTKRRIKNTMKSETGVSINDVVDPMILEMVGKVNEPVNSFLEYVLGVIGVYGSTHESELYLETINASADHEQVIKSSKLPKWACKETKNKRRGFIQLLKSGVVFIQNYPDLMFPKLTPTLSQYLSW